MEARGGHISGSVRAVSMTLVLWKAPVVGDPDEAKALLEAYYENEDDSAFEPSEDIARVREELLRRFPDPASVEGAAASSPWADFPPEETDRLLLLSIRWGADNAVLDDTIALARAHELVLYDPQGPDVYLPSHPINQTEPLRLGFADYAKTSLFVLAGVILFAAGWWLPVPVLNWLLMIAGGFLTSAAVFLLAILVVGPKEDRP
jgi:hypothetical protein